MINRFKTYIENEPWEDKIPAWEKRGDFIAGALMIFAVLYWAFCILRAVLV